MSPTDVILFVCLLFLQTYFNPESLSLIRTLITGGTTPELDQTLAEGVGMIEGGQGVEEVQEMRDRCRVTLIPLENGILEDYQVINMDIWYWISVNSTDLFILLLQQDTAFFG